MPAIALGLVGLSSGVLLTTMGLMVWRKAHPVDGVLQVVRVLRWLVGAFLLMSLYPLWTTRQPLTFSLVIAAAIAAPAVERRRSPWGEAIVTLSAFTLTVAGLALIAGVLPTPPRRDVTWLHLALAICNGLAVRALGPALTRSGDPAAPCAEPWSDILYLSVSLLVGASALIGLWQRGTLWTGAANEARLTSLWLAWGAARLGRRWLSPRLHAGLIVLVTGLLVWITLRTLFII